MALMCRTRWDGILAATPGTPDAAMLAKLNKTTGTFALYARLRTQLAHRTLPQIQLHPECPEFPFVWPPVASDDFYFEDAMRMAAQLESLKTSTDHKGLQKALALTKALLHDVHVHKWQALPLLPTVLRHALLVKNRKQLRIAYVDCIFRQFTLESHPLDESPAKSLPIVRWLSQENRAKYAGYLHWAHMETLFRRALADDDEAAMRCAQCMAKKAEAEPSSPPRALERAAYIRHFALVHFPTLPTGGHECVAIEEEDDFNAHVLFEKIPCFDWAAEAEGEAHMFTV